MCYRWCGVACVLQVCCGVACVLQMVWYDLCVAGDVTCVAGGVVCELQVVWPVLLHALVSHKFSVYKEMLPKIMTTGSCTERDTVKRLWYAKCLINTLIACINQCL